MPEIETAEVTEIVDPFANHKPEDFKKVNANEIPPVDEPINKETEVEKPTEVKPEAETKEEIKKEEKPAEVVPEIKPEETKPEIKPETKAEVKPEVKPVDWKEELKKADRDEALKLLGLDEFEIGLLKYRKETGDLTPYLEAKSVDYTKMSGEEIMRRNLRSLYKDLPDDEFDLIYQDEVTDRYKLDPDAYDEAAQKLGKIKLKVDSERVRQELIGKQAQFKIPERQKEEVKPDNKAEEIAAAHKKMAEEWEQNVRTNAATKELTDNKRLVLGGKESQFNYEVEDPEAAADAAVDNTKFWSLFNSDEHGTDFNKFYRVREYAKNPEKFEKALIDYGKSLGRKAEIDELKNPSKPEVGNNHQETTGDFHTDIGQAFLKRGVIRKNI